MKQILYLIIGFLLATFVLSNCDNKAHSQHFKNAEEEYRWLIQANMVKREIADNALSIISILDIRNPEALDDEDIEYHLSQIDSLFERCL